MMFAQDNRSGYLINPTGGQRSEKKAALAGGLID
jgi:hypothetical protein